jgi:hypothetical protein
MTSKRRPRRAQGNTPKTSAEMQKAVRRHRPGTPPRADTQPARRGWASEKQSLASRERGGAKKKRRPALSAVRRRAKACRNELRSLFLGVTDGTPEFVPALGAVYGQPVDDAGIVASLRELTARGRKILGSQDVLVMERCRRMCLERELLDQARYLAVELRRALHE